MAMSAAATAVTIELHGRVVTGAHRPGTTILQVARELGLAPPSSCEAGNCATCIAKLVEGEALMRTNDALTDEEVAEGWVLTCQAVPTSLSVRVVYD
jgi:ferredoxin